MRLKPLKHRAVLLSLLLFTIAGASAWVVSPVHAAGPALVQSAIDPGGLEQNQVTVGWNNNVAAGDLLVVHTFCMVGGSISTVSDQAGSIWTSTIVNARTQIWTAFAKASSNDGIILTWSSCQFGGSPGGAMSMAEYSGVGSIGSTFHNDAVNDPSCASACTKTNSITIGVNGALVVETFEDYNPTGGACPTIGLGGSSQILVRTLPCLNGLAGSFSQGVTVYAPNRGIGINSFSMTANNWAEVGHELLELDPPGGSPSNLGTQTACFGNCGNPAVTLANTNSTHSVAFNQTITLLYTFQSQLNGQVLNVTTSLAKSYSNGQTMTLGVYTVPVCPPGITGFTTPCPGVLQTQTTFNLPAKGRTSINNLAVPVSAGQWVGIAVTALYTGLDLNDTNTQVVMLQASGSMPASISQTTTFSTTSKVGMWAYVTGNVVTGTPPPTTVGGLCFGLDCILTNAVNSLCTVVSAACQTASSMFLVIILTIISILVLAFFFNQILPTVNIGRLGLGEIGILIFVMWIAIFTSFSLMSLYVLAITFSIVAILMGKRVSGYI